MNVIIIDSGVSVDLSTKTHFKSIQGISITKSGESLIFGTDYSDNIGHGTIVANILNEYLSVDIYLYVIKIIEIAGITTAHLIGSSICTEISFTSTQYAIMLKKATTMTLFIKVSIFIIAII